MENIHALAAQGLSIREISEATGLSKSAFRRAPHRGTDGGQEEEPIENGTCIRQPRINDGMADMRGETYAEEIYTAARRNTLVFRQYPPYERMGKFEQRR